MWKEVTPEPVKPRSEHVLEIGGTCHGTKIIVKLREAGDEFNAHGNISHYSMLWDGGVTDLAEAKVRGLTEFREFVAGQLDQIDRALAELSAEANTEAVGA